MKELPIGEGSAPPGKRALSSAAPSLQSGHGGGQQQRELLGAWSITRERLQIQNNPRKVLLARDRQ